MVKDENGYRGSGMNIALLYPTREKKSTGVRNLTKGTIIETLNVDLSNQYTLFDDPYFGTGSMPFSTIRWGGVGDVESCLRYDFMCYCKNIDIIHSYWPTFEFMRAKCVKLFTIYDLIPLIHPEWHPLSDYFDGPVRNSARKADLIIADSKYTRKDVIEYYDISPERVKVVYPGLMHTLDFTRADLRILDKFNIHDEYIVSVSTIEPRKNLRGLIKGFIAYKQTHTHSKLKLVLVGEMGWDNEFEKDISQLNQFRDSIIFPGFVSDEELVSLYQFALAVAYVSFYEGFGLPLLEALSAGKAVISSDTTSMPEVCGEYACYCNPYDVDSIENAIEKVVTDETFRKHLEQNAKVQASKFSYKKAAKETIDIYSTFER